MNRIFWVGPKNGMSDKFCFAFLLRSHHTPRRVDLRPRHVVPQDVIASVLRGQYSPLSRPMEPGGGLGEDGLSEWSWSSLYKWLNINGFSCCFFWSPLYTGPHLVTWVFGHTLLGCCFFFSFMGKSKVYVYIPKEIVPSLTNAPGSLMLRCFLPLRAVSGEVWIPYHMVLGDWAPWDHGGILLFA